MAVDEIDNVGLREKVAVACRILANEGVSRAAFGHVSVRLGEAGPVLIKSRGRNEEGLEFAEAKDIVLMDLEGTRLAEDELNERDDGLTPPSEKHIHLSIYRRRPDVGCVIHAHPAVVVALTATGRQLLPIYGSYDPTGLSILTFGLAYFDSSMLIHTDELGDAVANCLGEGCACVMRGHGITVVGRDIEEAVARAVALTELARVNWMACATGMPVPIEHEDIAFFEERTALATRASRVRTDGRRADWYYFLRRLGRAGDRESNSDIPAGLLEG
jgi:ribulose-5-phosphate 4-epimerase/fuculose-1-phosphate aldolase